MSEKKKQTTRKRKPAKSKRPKRVKLEPKARIRRRLMKLWTMAVHAQFMEKCAVCGSDYKPNAHHIESRIMFKGLRYDPMNGVLLCPTHHKFGKDSAHMAGCWFANWLKEHLPERYAYVLAHHADPDPDLEDREILASIEAMLRRTLEPYGDYGKPKKKPPFDPEVVLDVIRTSKPELGEVTEAEVRKALDEVVRDGQCTRAEADQLLKEIQDQKATEQETHDDSHTPDHG